MNFLNGFHFNMHAALHCVDGAEYMMDAHKFMMMCERERHRACEMWIGAQKVFQLDLQHVANSTASMVIYVKALARVVNVPVCVYANCVYFTNVN